MKILINSKISQVDEIYVKTAISSVTRQFNFKDISNIQKYKQGDIVEIYDDNDELLIKAEIEYVKAIANDRQSEFIYAGRNNAKLIVDSFMDKTVQFTEKQKLNSVLSEIAGQFGLSIKGDAQLPQENIKTILVGDNIGKALLEITYSAGQILTSDAEGNLIIEFEAKNDAEKVLEYGKNIRERVFVDDKSNVYDVYVYVSQSNYLINQQQDVYVNGKFGSGKKKYVYVSEHNLNSNECEKIAEIHKKKDIRKSFVYSVVVDDSLKLNTKYYIKDEAVMLNEKMNLKMLEYIKTAGRKETRATFEKVI